MSEQGTQPADVEPHSVGSGVAIARNAFYLVVGQAATMALGIVLSAALGRSLGAADFGLYYLITSMSAFAYVFVEWGQPYLVIRRVAQEPAQAGDLLGTSLLLRAVFAIAMTVPMGLAAWALGYDSRTTWLAVSLILATLPPFLAQGYGMVFRGHDRMGRDAVVSVSNKAMVLAVALPALALGAGIPGVIAAQGVAGVIALAVAARLYKRLAAPALRVSAAMARDLVRSGVPLLAMTVAVSAQSYLDAILLSKLSPANVVGWYGAAKSILGTLMAPAVILGGAAYPRIARASHDPAALRMEARAAFRPLVWLAALAGTGTYLFAGNAVDLIYSSRGFAPAATILQVFAPGFFLLFVDILLGNIIYASGGGTGFAVAKIVSVAVGTGLDVLLIPLCQQRYGNGGIGVVVAFALSEVFVFGGALLTVPRGALDPALALDGARSLGAAGATLLLFYLVPALPPWLGVPSCVAVFTAVSMALGLVSRRDLALLRSLVSSRRPEAR